METAVLRILILVGLLGMSRTGFGQESVRRLINSYENLTLDSSTRTVYYEQRLYRNPMIGMLELHKALVKPQVTDFVPMYQGMPIARYRLTAGLPTTTLSRADRTAFANAFPFDGRRYKFDFRLLPQFIANFGYRERSVESKTNLLLQSQFYLRRGLVLNWGILFPIVNDLDNQALNVRPAPIYVNQFLAIDQTNFLSASAGLFYNDRYGVNLQYRHADLTKNWSFGLETSLTGFYFFPPSGVYYESLNELMVLADVAYRLPRRDITIKVSGGQYLYQDRGGRLDIFRQFPAVEIGFFVTQTGNGSTGGFSLAVPIPPGRLVQTQRFRVRTAEEFRWEYNYSRGYNIAVRYKAGNPLDALLRQYHQRYLANQLTVH